MLPKSVFEAAKLFNIFYYKTWLIPYDYRFHKTGNPLTCVLTKSKWRKFKFIQGFLNTVLGVLMAIFLTTKMASVATENPKVFALLIFTILAGVSAVLACMCMVTILRDMEDVSYVIGLTVQVDTLLEGLFKEERKKIKPSIWYCLVGCAMWLLIIAMALMAILFGLVNLIEKRVGKGTLTLSRIIVQLAGYPTAKRDQVLARIIGSFFVFTPAIHLVAVITFYIINFIGICIILKFWTKFLLKLDRSDERERKACRILTILIQEPV